MKPRSLIVGIVSALMFFGSLSARAENNDKLKVFLTTCAYGTAAGAVAGLGSLVFSSNPSGSLNNIAIGASLGLYVGIGFGLYFINNAEVPAKQEMSSTYLTPQWHQGRVDGAQIHYSIFQF